MACLLLASLLEPMAWAVLTKGTMVRLHKPDFRLATTLRMVSPYTQKEDPRHCRLESAISPQLLEFGF